MTDIAHIRRNRNRWRAVMIAVCLLGVAPFVCEEVRYRIEYDTYQAAMGRAVARADAGKRAMREGRFDAIFKLPAGDRSGRELPTQAQIEAGLFGGHLPDVWTDGNDFSHYPDAARGFTWVIRYHDDGAYGPENIHPSYRPFPLPSRRMAAWQWAWARWPWGLGPLAWLAALLMVALPTRHRRLLAEASLLLAASWIALYLTDAFRPLKQTSDYSRLPIGLAMAAISVVAMYATRRGRIDESSARCAACGYDLTGNESGTCPECGSAVPPLTLPAPP